MGLETGNFITDLNPAWPTGADPVSEGNDHDKLIKSCVQQSFHLINAPVDCDPADLNLLAGAAASPNGTGLVPTGSVVMFINDSPPTGWLLCNGAAIDAGFTALIALVGANTPDMRGQFVRGWSDDDVVDPDGARAPLNAQAEDLKSHQHSLDRFESGAAIGVSYVQTDDDDSETPSQLDTPTGLTGGDETRPVNIAMAYIIKT